MSKKTTRAELRGKHLIDEFCHSSLISHNEYGPTDNRHYCYGRINRQTEELSEECASCKANVRFVTPLGGKLD